MSATHLSKAPRPVFKVVIPARFASTRFPGKPLADIHGQPMIAHVYARAKASGAQEVIVATDDERILAACAALDMNAQMTSSEHQSGSDRIAEVARHCGWAKDSIIVNLQGDEPAIPAVNIIAVAQNLAQCPDADMATLAEAISDAGELTNPNIVKVVRNRLGHALRFSRRAIPWPKNADEISKTNLRHIGIYAYRCQFLLDFSAYGCVSEEKAENLEQLRVFSMGRIIHLGLAPTSTPPGVDTEADLLAVRRLLAHDIES